MEINTEEAATASQDKICQKQSYYYTTEKGRDIKIALMN